MAAWLSSSCSFDFVESNIIEFCLPRGRRRTLKASLIDCLRSKEAATDFGFGVSPVFFTMRYRAPLFHLFRRPPVVLAERSVKVVTAAARIRGAGRSARRVGIRGARLVR